MNAANSLVGAARFVVGVVHPIAWSNSVQYYTDLLANSAAWWSFTVSVK